MTKLEKFINTADDEELIYEYHRYEYNNDAWEEDLRCACMYELDRRGYDYVRNDCGVMQWVKEVEHD